MAFSLIIQKVCGVGHAGRELGSGSGHRNNLTNNLHSPSHHILKLLFDEQSRIFSNNLIHNLGNFLSIIVLFVSIKVTMISIYSTINLTKYPSYNDIQIFNH